MAKYRAQRYDESRRENGNFFFGPRALLLFGAASFLYEAFPSSLNLNTPDYDTISSFFGAVKVSGPGNATGGYDKVPERIPKNWANRLLPYTLLDVLTEILAQYVSYPRLFGGNAGVGNFDPLDIPLGSLGSNATVNDVACEFYQALFQPNVPGKF
jgi:unspecific peroxygenase